MCETQKNKQELGCISPGHSWAEDRTKAEHRFCIHSLTTNRGFLLDHARTRTRNNKNTGWAGVDSINYEYWSHRGHSPCSQYVSLYGASTAFGNADGKDDCVCFK